MVCAKSGVGRKAGLKNWAFVLICKKSAPEKETLGSSGRLL